MKNAILTCLMLAAGLLLSACTNTIKYDEAIHNETLNHEVGQDELLKSTESMVIAMMDDAAVQEITKGKRPVLAVFGLVDFTSEGIDIATLNNNILVNLNKTGHFRFADSSALSAASTRLNPNLYDVLENPVASAPLTDAVKADYLLIGEVSRIIRTQPDLKQVFYRISLNLVDPKNKTFVWQEKREFLKSQKKIVYGI